MSLPISVRIGRSGRKRPVFQSDWRTATGTSATAQSDGGKWNAQATGCTVIANPGDLGFPVAMPNLLQVPWNGAFAFCRTNTLPVPAVGVTRCYRYYFRLEIPDGVADVETHPIQDGFSTPTCNWQFIVWHNLAGAGRWRPQFDFLGNAYPNQRWRADATSLLKAHTYRIEHALQRTGVATQKSQVRIYDQTGALVVTNADLFQEDSTTVTLASADPTFALRDVNELAGLNAGCNDTGTESGLYALQGGVAVCDDQDWTGPYGDVEGED